MTDTPPDRVETLVAALARTYAANTARLHFVSLRASFPLGEVLDGSGHGQTAGMVREVAAFGKRAADRFVGGHPGEPSGVIDFVQQRSLYARSAENWFLTTPRCEFSGEPGEWELEIAADDAIGYNQPFWLLALLAGLVDAQSEDERTLRDERCRVFKAVASHSRAAKAAPMTLGPFGGGPRLAEALDVERMPLEVWLDGENRVLAGGLGDRRGMAHEPGVVGLRCPGPDRTAAPLRCG
jgi:hypothetical protein